MNAPKISIIVPMYNVARYVRASLTAVQKQTFTDWECICVDDGGPDNAADIVAEFVAADPRIILIRQQNTGVSGARNHGLELARGEYFTFLDPDDVYAPQHLEMMFAAAQQDDVDLVQTDIGAVPDSFELAYPDEPPEPIDMAAMNGIVRRGADEIFDHWQKDFKNGGLWAFVWRNLYRRSALGHVRFVQNIWQGEDDIYIWTIMPLIHSYTKLKTISMYYRRSKTSVMSTLDRPENTDRKIDNRIAQVLAGYRLAVAMHDKRWRTLYLRNTMESLYRIIFLVLAPYVKYRADVLRANVGRKMLRDLKKFCRVRPRIAVELFFHGYDALARKVLKIK